MKRWQVYSHDNTLVGRFEQFKDAVAEGCLYQMNTGKPYFIEDANILEDDDEE